jgi:hypothetical protein
MKLAIKIALGLVGLLALAATIFALTFDANRYKPALESAARDATGRTLRVERDLSLRLLPSPALRVEGVSLANAEWGSQPEMLRVGRFAAEVGLLSLLRGAPEVKRLVLEDVELLLETNAKGEGNWRLAGAKKPGAPETPAAKPEEPGASAGTPLVPLVREVALRDLRATYRDGRTGRARTVTLERGAIAADGADAPVSLDLAGVADGLPFTLEGELGAISGLLSGDAPWPLKLAATLAESTRLELEGTIARPREARGIALAVRATSSDLSALARMAETSAPVSGPVSFRAALSDPAPKQFALRDLELTSAAADVKGVATVDLSGARPALDAELASSRIDLTKLAGAAAAAAGAAAGGGGTPAVSSAPANDGRKIPATPLPFASLGAADANVRFRADTLVTSSATLRELSGALALRDGELALRDVKAALAGGSLALGATLSAKDESAGTKLSLAGVDLGALLRESGSSDLVRRAPSDVELDVRGRGATVREIAATLGGRLVSITRNAEVDSRALDLLGDAASLWKPLAGDGGVTKLSCAVLRFDVRSGVARATTLFADVGPAVITGDGTVDLGQEALKLVLTPRASVDRLAKVPVPLLVDGSFTKPVITPDVVSTALGAAQSFGSDKLREQAGAIASLLGVSEAGAGPPTCEAAVAQAQGRAAPTAEPTPETPAESPTKDAVRSLERGLRGLLGK